MLLCVINHANTLCKVQGRRLALVGLQGPTAPPKLWQERKVITDFSVWLTVGTAVSRYSHTVLWTQSQPLQGLVSPPLLGLSQEALPSCGGMEATH